MASKTLKKDTELGADGTKTAHDAKARKKIILETIKGAAEIEAKVAALNEQKRELIQSNIKGKLGMKIADFAAARRVYSLEQEDRDQFFDTLRETFEALGVGAQLDFLAATAPANDGPVSMEAERGMTYEAGYQAGKSNVAQTDNPHPKGSAKAKVWNEGWLKAQQDIAEEMGGGKKTGGGDAAGKTITKKAAKAQK